MMMSRGSKPSLAAGEPRLISSITTPWASGGICRLSASLGERLATSAPANGLRPSISRSSFGVDSGACLSVREISLSLPLFEIRSVTVEPSPAVVSR
jgi:hypothetical protein